MEFPDTKSNEDHDLFSDAFDDFPIYDGSLIEQSEPSTSGSSVSHPADPPEPKLSSELRRRKLSHREFAEKDLASSSPISSEIGSTTDVRKTSFLERKDKIYQNLMENEKERESFVSNQSQVEDSTLTTVSRGDSADASFESLLEFHDSSSSSSSNLLVFIAGLVIKAIGFQINLFISFITFPIWLLYNSYMFVMNPFQAIKLCKSYFVEQCLKLWDITGARIISPKLYEWFKDPKSISNVAFHFGVGFLWATCVCIALFGLLLWSFLIGGFIVRYFVEEPVQMKELLNFDYTKDSPVAYVPLISCSSSIYGWKCEDDPNFRKNEGSRVIPLRHKMQVTVSLTLPESEYNRNLGVFQVRVDFLSESGKTIASLSHPTMLHFKSEPIHLLLTFLKIAPLITGYSYEAQTLNLNIKGFTEGDIPTACLRVTIEQRAEFSSGAGIPEIYDASLILESRHPLIKRIMWYWKKTIFIWTSMMFFTMGLLCALICCRSIIVPRARVRGGSSRGSSTNNNSLQSEIL